MNNAIHPETPSLRMIRLMGVVSLVCGLLIVGTNFLTLAPIRHNQEVMLREAVTELLPGLEKQVIYQIEPSGLTIVDTAEGAGQRLYAGYDKSGVLIGVVAEAAAQGYGDTIRSMYAYSPEKEAIIGFKVVEMKETPGLGDKIGIDKAFQANFKNLQAKLDAAMQKLEHAIVTVKHGTKKNPWEVDAISGATISSRAVGVMLNRSANAFVPVIRRNLERIRKGS